MPVASYYRISIWCSAFIALAVSILPADEPFPLSEVAPAAAHERWGDAWSDPRNPVAKRFDGERLDLWSLRPIAEITPPESSFGQWERNPIDRFIAARLAAAQLAPAPIADRQTLARRLAFDLTGMPPEPEVVERFRIDARPDAYEQLVDSFLNSPRFGEHLARLWLDVVRYSDSNGFDWDEFRPHAWRYRDYVIRSFNADKPFDRFLTEQLAGDELFTATPQTAEDQDALIATGFLRLGPHDNAAPLFNEQDRSRAELLADVVETTGSAFLGLTLACCRCHDHKNDPLLQADHYRLRAFFESIKFADQLSIDLAAEQEEIRIANEALDEQQKEVERQRDELLAPTRTMLGDRKKGELTDDERKLLDLPEGERTDEQKTQIAELQKRIAPSDQEIEETLDEPIKGQLAEKDESIRDLKNRRRKLTTGLLMTNSDEVVPDTHILAQGDHRAPRDVVPAGFLSILDPNPAELPTDAVPPGRGRRLAFANWLTSAENPLTARVYVNRLWQQLFGRGLVATPNDFGLAGATPSHPELLDWLASEFMRNSWSTKHVVRLIVTSAAYRQGAPPPTPADSPAVEQDSQLRRNLICGRSARRLSAEQLRDSLLFVAGMLTSKSDGPPIWPDLPEDVLKANPAFLDDNDLKIKGWYPSPLEEQSARSIFLVQKRTVRIPFLETFDLPENIVSCPQRAASTVPPQALSLLNSPMSVRAFQSFAERIVREAGGETADQIQAMYRLALQRRPAKDELSACTNFLRDHSLAELCRVVLNLNEFQYYD